MSKNNPLVPGAKVWYRFYPDFKLAATIVEIYPERNIAILLVHNQRDGLPLRSGKYDVFKAFIDSLSVRE